MTWQDAVLDAIERFTKQHGSTTFNREEFLNEELDRMASGNIATGSIGVFI